MGKTRFTTLDVAAMVREFRRDLIGLRLANVYDCGRRTFVLKLSRPDCKRFVLLESGVRIHTTEYARDAGGAAERAPSIFALKLRKLLRTKRLEDVRQLGVDRVLDFQFGLDDLESHLLVELYAAGNVVVTDRAYTVQMLLRSHRYSEEFAVALHEPYPLRLVRPRETPWRGALLAALRAANAPESWLAAAERVADYGSMLSRHALLRAGFDPAAAADPGDSAAVARLEQALEWCHAQLDWAAPTDGPAQGVLFLREGAVLAPPPPAAAASLAPTADDAASLTSTAAAAAAIAADAARRRTGAMDEVERNIGALDDVSPIAWLQYANRERLVFDSFAVAVDRYFSNLEAQRSEEKMQSQQSSVIKRVEKARSELDERVERLKREELQYVRYAELLRENAEEVDAVRAILLSELSSGIRWADLGQVVRAAQKNGDPRAQIIDSLRLADNMIVLLLTDRYTDGDEDDMARELERVELRLDQNAFTNAEHYYDLMKKAQHKLQGTLESSQAALKGAEKRAKQQIGEIQMRNTVQKLRKPYWFEKFHWFLSSENFVVVAGRDMQQNELLVKRYLRRGDAYVHADVHGAASVVVKNYLPAGPNGVPPEVPARTLAEAGQFCICRSSAWKGKHTASSYWVHAEQVSKTAPTGEYLGTGSFMIRGHKNFLPPMQLELGFALLFKLDEESATRHRGERRVRGNDEESQSALSEVVSLAPRADDATSAALDYGAEHAGDDGDRASSSDGDDDADDDPAADAPAASRDSVAQDCAAGSRDRDDGVDGVDGDDSTGNEDEDEDDDIAAVAAMLGSYHAPVYVDTPEVDAPDAPGSPAPSSRSSRAALNAAAEQHDFIINNPIASEILLGPGARPESRVRLSAAERRRLKRSGRDAGAPARSKEGCFDGDGDGDSQDRPDDAHGRADVTAGRGNYAQKLQQPQKQQQQKQQLQKQQQQKQQPQKKTRGKHGKEKKQARRYAGQDDEERALRMAMLHVGESVEAQQPVDASSSQQIPPGKLGDKDRVSIFGALEHATFETRVQKKTRESGDASVQQARRDRRQLQREDNEDLKLMVEQEQLKMDEIDQRNREADIDSLTGAPRDDDVLLFAVPVCGPYAALHGYRFRVKLVPGSLKSGKAAHGCMEFFQHTRDLRPRERELMRCVPDDELNSRMISGVRLATAGAQVKSKKKKPA